MTKNYAKKVINGSFGKLIINGEELAEVTKFEAKITLETSAVNMCGTLRDGEKVTGQKCEGSITLNKISSYFTKLLNDNMKAGKSTIVTLIASVEDPDNGGVERIAIKDALLKEMFFSFGSKTLSEETYSFTFTEWEYLDLI